MFSLRNLSSQEVTTGLMPWDFKLVNPIPEEVRKNKKKRDEWINNPLTEHNVYTFSEGVNPNQRISTPRNDGGGNPIHSDHGLVADFDSPISREFALDAAQKMSIIPNALENTLSGNWRFIWRYETRMVFPSHDFAKFFRREFPKFGFDPAKALPGFDKPAWESVERMWTNSGEWIVLHGDLIPSAITAGWLMQASEKYRWAEKGSGPVIPLEVIKAEFEKRYPKFNQWPGEFTLGSQGPTFWIDQSTSPKSAIVRDTGMQTFSDHAGKGFFSWRDLLGADFVKEYEARSLGEATKDIHFDGRVYWRRANSGLWLANEKTELVNHLKVARQISTKFDKEGISEMDRVLNHIHDDQRVMAAAPFVFRKTGIIFREGYPYLNICNVKLLAPADGTALWGPDGQFPFVSKLLDMMFCDFQRTLLISWASYAYQNAFKQLPVTGHILFIAGPPDSGKTLLNREVFGRIFGGFAEAGAYLLKDDSFNAELFNSGYWVMDDAIASSDPRRKSLYNAALKRVAANTSFRCNEKFKTATLAEWVGRLGITCNVDEESGQIFPDLSTSIKDKLILLRTQDALAAGFRFPTQSQIQSILAKERPWFARYLLDFSIPPELIGSPRWGVIDYAEPSIATIANQSSQSASFAEILSDWKVFFFTKQKPGEKYWEGTAYQLHKEILTDQTAAQAMQSFSADKVGRQLSTLKSKGAKLETSTKGGLRYWRIFPDTDELKTH